MTQDFDGRLDAQTDRDYEAHHNLNGPEFGLCGRCGECEYCKGRDEAKDNKEFIVDSMGVIEEALEMMVNSPSLSEEEKHKVRNLQQMPNYIKWGLNKLDFETI